MVKLLSVRLGHLLLLFSVFVTSSSQAALLFSQNPLTSPAPVFSGPPSIGLGKVIDNFMLTSGAELTEIEFWTFEGQGLVSNEFDLAIYSNLGGTTIDAPIWSAMVSRNQLVETLVADFGAQVGQLYSHTLTLATPQNLLAGDYFFQVAASPTNGSPSPVGWQLSAISGTPGAPPAAISPLQSNQIIFGDINTNMAFRLAGNLIQTIPTPSTFWLLALIFSGYLLRRKS
ncbi:hypothetical protein DXX93_13055 [Thalassotalea euphylliae]|uniref:PEP-CTERM sorting domain-containing protein n=1 Tax=Thalassotalea euphylliae TaxID=1655234 RepID=A0A3E0TSE7_9GAMM|nr:hypothetical protein [Thalassotalea euphylliae]REL27403.1 hypothetical protein DXX93_13055 [Thalassotalea euphylliae]